MKHFDLVFNGYWPKEAISSMPEYDGIYCVYVGRRIGEGTVYLRRLIYIGKTNCEGGIRGRLSSHEKMEDFENMAARNEEVYFSCAPVNETDLKRVEDALIYSQQPPLNEQSKESFNHPTTELNVSGKCSKIEEGVWQGDRGDVIVNLK